VNEYSRYCSNQHHDSISTQTYSRTSSSLLGFYKRNSTENLLLYYILYIYYFIIVYALCYNIYPKIHATTISLPCVYHENNMSESRTVDLFLFYFSSIIYVSLISFFSFFLFFSYIGLSKKE